MDLVERLGPDILQVATASLDEAVGDDEVVFATYSAPIELADRDVDTLALRHGVPADEVRAVAASLALPGEVVLARWSRGEVDWRVLPEREGLALWRQVTRGRMALPIAGDQLPVRELHEAWRAAYGRGEAAEAYQVAIEDEATPAYALVLPARGRAGIAHGEQVTWYDADSVAELVRVWVDEEWYRA